MSMTIEEMRTQSYENWRRRQRKLAVYKVAGVLGLTILICGSTLSLIYALGW